MTPARHAAQQAPVSEKRARKPAERGRKARNRPSSSLGPEVAQRLIAACSRRAPTGRRNAALVALLSGCWARVSEVLALEARDIDLEERTVHIRTGKGRKDRTVALAPWAVPAIEQWAETRSKLLGRHARRAPFLCTLDGKGLWDSYVRRMLPRLAQRAGIRERVHSHAFRHGAVLSAVRGGMDLAAARDQAGHGSVAVTDGYMRRATPKELAAALAKLEQPEPAADRPEDAGLEAVERFLATPRGQKLLERALAKHLA